MVKKLNINASVVEDIEYRIDSSRRFFSWSELWRYRELFYFFTWRDIKVKYKQTILGFLWAVLQPIIMMVIFTFFFGGILNDPSQKIPYPVYVFSGLLLWNVFSSGLLTAAASMVGNAGIIKKIYFPRLIIPVSSILVALFDCLMTFIVFVPMLIFFKQHVSLHVLWCWPLSLLFCVVATLGPSCWLAALNVKYRDFRYVIPFLVQMLFFVTPVIYPIKLLKYEWLRYIITASPMYAAVEMFRFPLTGNAPDTLSMIISAFSAFIILFIGLAYFKNTEDFFADFA